MQKKSGRTLLKGTLILIIGNIIVKIIGAFFKLPLANIIGADGMGLYNASFIVYDIFLVITTSGFPLAISKMVANASAHGNDYEALKIFRVTRDFFIITGLTGAAAMAGGAKFFSGFIGNTRSYPCILVLSPAIVFVSLMSAYRGYYQGTNDMIPTTISQVAEAVARLVVGLTLSWELKKAGFGIEIASAGALVGITVGEFTSTSVLALIHSIRQRKSPYRRKEDIPPRILRKAAPARKIIAAMFKTSIPIAASTLIISIINMLDNSVIMHRLQTIGFNEQQANTLYGCFNMAFTVFSLPITIVSAVTVSVFPILSYAYAAKDFHTVSKAAGASLRIAMLAAAASAALFVSLSFPIIHLLYFSQPRDAAIAAPLLLLLGPSAVVIALTMITSCILQAIDKLMTPSFSMIAGGVVCLGMNWLLVGQKGIGIYAAPAGIFACYLLTTVLNLHAIRKSKKVRLSFKNLFAKPFLPAVSMALAGIGIFRLLEPSLGTLKAAGIAIFFGILVYFTVLFLNHGIEAEDLEMLPKGKQIAAFLRRLRLLPQ